MWHVIPNLKAEPVLLYRGKQVWHVVCNVTGRWMRKAFLSIRDNVSKNNSVMLFNLCHIRLSSVSLIPEAQCYHSVAKQIAKVNKHYSSQTQMEAAHAQGGFSFL